MNKLVTRPLSLVIAPKGAPAHSESAVVVELEDYGNGEFLAISTSSDEPGKIQLDWDDWDALVAAVAILRAQAIEPNGE